MAGLVISLMYYIGKELHRGVKSAFLYLRKSDDPASILNWDRNGFVGIEFDCIQHPYKIRDASGTLFGKWKRRGFRENLWGSGRKEAPHSLSFMTLGGAQYLAKIHHTLNGHGSSRPLRQIPSTPTYRSLNNNRTRLQSPQIQLPSPHPRILLVLEA